MSFNNNPSNLPNTPDSNRQSSVLSAAAIRMRRRRQTETDRERDARRERDRLAKQAKRARASLTEQLRVRIGNNKDTQHYTKGVHQ